MRANEFITESSNNVNLENALNKMVYGYLHGRSAEKNTCYSYVGEQLARIKPDDATIRFWGRKPNLIVHGDAVLPSGEVISTASPDKYDKFGYELVYTMPLSELLARVSPDENLDEMALPADWDPSALGHDKTFKSRLEYALQRAPRLGGGSSRVAFVIPDNGRETVLKIAKNNKGTAQNEAEVDILTDGYTGRLDIVIPIVDYDKANNIPTWIQTEKANKVSQTKLRKLLHCDKSNWGISNFTYAVHNILGTKKSYMPDLKKIKEDMLNAGHTEQELDIFFEYVNEVATLVSSSSLLVDDLGSASNWGEYKGKPVIIDLGFTEAVKPLYTRAWR
jgi:hypothetical protein